MTGVYAFTPRLRTVDLLGDRTDANMPPVEARKSGISNCPTVSFARITNVEAALCDLENARLIVRRQVNLDVPRDGVESYCAWGIAG